MRLACPARVALPSALHQAGVHKAAPHPASRDSLFARQDALETNRRGDAARRRTAKVSCHRVFPTLWKPRVAPARCPLQHFGSPAAPSEQTPPVPCPSGHWQPWRPHPCASRSPVQCHPCVKPCAVPSWCHAELTLSPTCSLYSALGLCHHARCASPARPPRHTPSRQCDTLALQCHLCVTSGPCTHTAEPCAAPPALPPRPGSVTPCQPRSVPSQCATA